MRIHQVLEDSRGHEKLSGKSISFCFHIVSFDASEKLSILKMIMPVTMKAKMGNFVRYGKPSAIWVMQAVYPDDPPSLKFLEHSRNFAVHWFENDTNSEVLSHAVHVEWHKLNLVF